jgi:tRNA(His) guanylyltransferase
MSDTLGNYLKSLESSEVFDPSKYLYMRLDGRGFSKLTKNYAKPYDDKFMTKMQETAKALATEFSADIVYQQSDEISLVWCPVKHALQQQMFGGKKQKLLSLVPGFASSWLGLSLQKLLSFDARAYECSEEDVVKSLYWRHRDCCKNAVTMVAHELYSHKQLHGVTTNERLELMATSQLWLESPDEFKYGYLLVRKTQFLPMPDHVPEKYKTSDLIERSVLEQTKISKSIDRLADYANFIALSTRQ